MRQDEEHSGEKLNQNRAFEPQRIVQRERPHRAPSVQSESALSASGLFSARADFAHTERRQGTVGASIFVLMRWSRGAWRALGWRVLLPRRAPEPNRQTSRHIASMITERFRVTVMRARAVAALLGDLGPDR